MVEPKDDTRRVSELITAALCEPEPALAWDAIWALRWRGTCEVLDWAARLCSSPCRAERQVAANILGQLGIPDRTYPGECLGLLLKMLEAEHDQRVIATVLIALSHLERPEAIAPALALRHHSDADVRYAIVCALTGHEEPAAIEGLMELSRDEQTHVRDWATFALGSMVETDTPSLRAALVDRLSDPDADTRGEALVGLAQRGDRRVLPALGDELSSDCVGRLAVEAAALIGDPQLHSALVALSPWWDVDAELLAEAIHACSPHSGVPPAQW